MRKVEKRSPVIATFTFVSLILLAITGSATVTKPPGEIFEAIARGQSTQIRRMYNLNISINEYSTAEDQKALNEAFKSNGMQGLSEALSKMPSKGRLSITGTTGYDINYVRAFQKPYGRRIRLLTDRPILAGEVSSNDRSRDYNLSAIELDVHHDKSKTTGVLLPACLFKLDKKKQLQIENYVNSWKLTNVMQR